MTTCGGCGAAQPEGNRFCGECGAPLTAPPAERGRERKVVTVLFCDLVGFTSASDGADPEEVQARLSPYHARCRRVIEGFGGTVEKFIGDAVMAAFGAPVVHEDDPERAVRAGLALLEAVEELNAEAGSDLEVRIGIATGEAVVSLSVRPELGEGMLAGDVVNTAARIQTAAPVSAVLVSRPTYVATRAAIRYEPLDPVVAKGKAEPIQVWLAVSSRGSVGEDLADTSTPMVGREDELSALQRAFTRAVRESSVQLVTVVAEPGMGKSRLVQAFFDWIDGRDELVTWRQGRCPPYGDAVAFAALADIVKAQTGILDSDDADTVRSKLEDTLASLVAETELAEQSGWLVARLSPLVGLPSGEAPQEELFTAWRRFVEILAASGPMIMVLEDLHWADQALLDFLAHLLDYTLVVPLVIVATARPELYDKAPSWAAGQRNATTLSLAPLDDTETAQLITTFLGTRVLPADLHAALLDKAGGNPLYAREYLAILGDRPDPELDPVAVKELAESLPGSVQAVIAARLDTLPPETKRLLQTAAVIGHTFWEGALGAMTDAGDDDIQQRLHDLVRHDYLRRSLVSRIAGQSEYTFGHALIAEVAYGQLPRPDRARHHLAVAEWHSARITDPDSSPDAAVVAHHYTKAHNAVRGTDSGDADSATLAAQAATWLVHAAEHARHADPFLALRQVREALALTPATDPARSRGLILMGDLQFSMGEARDAEQSFTEAQETAEQCGEPVVAAHAQAWRAMVGNGVTLTLYESMALLDDAIARLERHPTGLELVDARVMRAFGLIVENRHTDALIAAQAAVDAIERLSGVSPVLRVKALNALGAARVWSGDTAGVEDLSRALEVATEHNLTEGTIFVNEGLSSWAYFARSAPEALGFNEIALEGASVGGRRGLHVWTAGALAELLAVTGRPEQAVVLCEQAAVQDQGVEDPRSWSQLHCYWAWALLVRGRLEAARSHVDEALRLKTSGDQLEDAVLMVAAEWEHSAGRRNKAAVHRDALWRGLEDETTQANLTQYLARLARLLVAGDHLPTLERMIASTSTGFVLHENNVRSARAVLAQALKQHREALALHEQAAVGWAAYGYPLEQAHAFIGAAECRRALGQPARHLLEQARDILRSMGASLLLAETEQMLADVSQ